MRYAQRMQIETIFEKTMHMSIRLTRCQEQHRTYSFNVDVDALYQIGLQAFANDMCSKWFHRWKTRIVRSSLIVHFQPLLHAPCAGASACQRYKHISNLNIDNSRKKNVLHLHFAVLSTRFHPRRVCVCVNVHSSLKFVLEISIKPKI